MQYGVAEVELLALGVFNFQQRAEAVFSSRTTRLGKLDAHDAYFPAEQLPIQRMLMRHRWRQMVFFCPHSLSISKPTPVMTGLGLSTGSSVEGE